MQFKLPNRFNRSALFLWKFPFVMIGEGQIFKSHQENVLIFAQILPRDNRVSSIFKWHHQIGLVFTKIPACDNRGRSNFQSTSTKLPYFAKVSARDNRSMTNLPYFCRNFTSREYGQCEFSSDFIKCRIF